MNVLTYQILFGFIQLMSLFVFGYFSFFMTFFGIILWTFLETWGDVQLIQLVVQTFIFIVLLKNAPSRFPGDD